jgi:hypothetical protein
VAGIELVWATMGEAAEEGIGDEGGGLMAVVPVVVGTGEWRIEPVATEPGLTVLGAEGASGELTGGTTVSDGRSCWGVTTARSSSGLRPSNSAF